MRLHANSPSRVTRTPACCISVRSASQRDSGHCSGYHEAPSRIAGGEGGVATVSLFEREGSAREGATTANSRNNGTQRLELFFINVPSDCASHGDSKRLALLHRRYGG